MIKDLIIQLSETTSGRAILFIEGIMLMWLIGAITYYAVIVMRIMHKERLYASNKD